MFCCFTAVVMSRAIGIQMGRTGSEQGCRQCKQHPYVVLRALELDWVLSPDRLGSLLKAMGEEGCSCKPVEVQSFEQHCAQAVAGWVWERV
jgi:hypothetical protein